VSKYEHEKRRITVTELPTLARALNVPLRYFFEGDINPIDQDRAILAQFHHLSTLRDRQAAIEILRVFTDAIEAKLR
jgi:transcriptional regulator with XRE-family HTH domain